MAGVERPQTRFVDVGSDRVAFQAFGAGNVDLVYIPTFGLCIDALWDYPPLVAFLARLGSLSRVITFDRRGFGASDPVSDKGLPIWEEWAADATAVLDTLGIERAVVYGPAEAGPTAVLFAATRPDRVERLILVDSAARFTPGPNYPWGLSQELADVTVEGLEQAWGTDPMVDAVEAAVPSEGRDSAYAPWLARSARQTCSPREAGVFIRRVLGSDVRDVLSSIIVPTLVVHGEGSAFFTIEQGRDLAGGIAGARFVAAPGSMNETLYADRGPVMDAIEEFLTGAVSQIEPDRALAAILFTDIVGSTKQASTLGDRRWKELLESHDATAKIVINRHGGRLVKLTGDGVLATFDGPGRAIRCASALRDSLEPLGITVREGLHTGEVELRGDDIGGIAVHVAARVLEQAGPSELVTSSAVPLLVAGSGIEFEDRGEHELKGVPGLWRLFAVKG